MNETTITIDDAENGIKIAHISGQLDESNVDEKIQDIYKVVEQNPKGLKLIFNLEKLEYMNSKSIGYLTDLYGKITESGGKVAIAKAAPNIVDILQVVGLTQLINSYDSLDEAKNALSTETEAAPTSETAPEVETPAEAPAEPETAPAPEPAPEAPAQPETAPAPAPETPAQPETAPAPEPAPKTPTATPAEPAPEVSVKPSTPETPAEPAAPETPAEPATPETTPETPAETPAPPQTEEGTYKFGQ